MSISISCSGCGSKLKTHDNNAGRILKCPKCKEKIIVPSLPSNAPENENTFDGDMQPSLNNDWEHPELEKGDNRWSNNNKPSADLSILENIKKFFLFNSNADSNSNDDLDDDFDDNLDGDLDRTRNINFGLSDIDIKIQKHRRRRIRKYFSPQTAPGIGCAGCFAVVVVIIGIIVLVAAISEINFLGIFWGFVFLILGLAMIPSFKTYKNNHQKWVSELVSDSEIDKYINDDLASLKKLSLQKSSLDMSELVGDQLLVTGFQFYNSADAKVLYKKGVDSIFRFTPINVTVLNLTANQIVCFQCVFDLTTGNPLNISTDEYFYKDVVSIATKTESGTYESELFEGEVQLDSSEKFVLTTSGGTTLHVFLSDPKLIEKMGGGKMPTTEAEKTILVVRKMLREKKSNT